MNSWNLMTKSVGKKDKNIIDNYINHEKKNSVLILGSPINMNGNNPDYAPSKAIIDKVMNIDDKLIQKYPINKFYASQGGAKRKTGSALYNKNSNIIMGGGAYRIRESTKRFLEGAGASYDYKYEDSFNPIKSNPDSMLSTVMKYIGQKITKPLLKKMFGGASTQSQLSAQQQAKLNETLANMNKGNQMRAKSASDKMDLKDEQMLEQKLNPLSKKELERRKQLSSLTPAQKKAYMRLANKKGVEKYNKQTEEFAKKGEEDRRYRESRDWANVQKGDRQEALDERARLEREARDKAEYEASKSWFDKVGEMALEQGLPELTKLIPIKQLQKPAEQLVKSGVSAMLGKGGKKRKPSAWNIKVKAYMNKHNCSMKDALQNLKK
jgi:hypothetical protein